MIGGLAAACFTKAFGVIFLGEPRQPMATPHEVDWTMRFPMVVLAAGCILVGLCAPVVVGSLRVVLGNMKGLQPENVGENLSAATGPLAWVVIGVAAFLLLLLALILLRRGLLAGRRVEKAVTWDCGYARPTARMQYTASSFVQPFTTLFRWLLGAHRQLQRPEGFFPAKASLATDTPDLTHEELYRPGFLKLNRGITKLRWMQQGHVQLYVLYIAVTLIVLLAWKFR